MRKFQVSSSKFQVPVVACLVVSWCAILPAADRISRVEQGLIPAIRIKGQANAKTLKARMVELKVPGVSAAVIEDGKIIWARGWGEREAGSGQAVTPETLFQAASISKPVAAFAALRLVEQGKLQLDEDVNAKLRSWKIPAHQFGQPVTLRHLLSHTGGTTVSGFPGYAASMPVPTLLQLLDGIKPANTVAIRVDIKPGERYRYSGGGYSIAQLLMQDVTGKPFPQLMRELVLDPVGMKSSTFEQPLPERLEGRAAGAHRPDGALIPGRWHTYPEMAAAGLWTTPSDLARFAVEMQKAAAGRSNLMKEETARQMLTVVASSYALGWGIQERDGQRRFGHGGSNAGFQCVLQAYVTGGRGAVVMTNASRGAQVGGDLLRAVAVEYGWPGYLPPEKTVVTVDPVSLAALAGKYQTENGDTLTVTAEAGRLHIEAGGAGKREFLAESPSEFFNGDMGVEVRFTSGGLVIDGRTKARRLN